jgi:HPt (histidine-containing phosphotransfer) domain-containing protein
MLRRRVRAGGASASARVLAMSAELPRAERGRLRAAGFHDALPKPLAAATLAALVGGTAATAPLRDGGAEVVLDDVHGRQALGSDDALRALRALLADELPVLRDALAVAAAAGDVGDQRELLHRLVGGAELCGARRLAHAARECSRALADGAAAPGAALDEAFAATLAAIVQRHS